METLQLIIQNNPGLVNILLTAVLLPLFIMALNNRHTRKMKMIEKNLDLQYKSKDDLREQEKKVYASLSRILFDVQQLHVSLSGTCVDTSCIENGLQKFDAALQTSHEEISNNMLYPSSDAINLLYTFYGEIGKLKIELKELDKLRKYEMAHAVVYYGSRKLADSLINIQELFISQRSDLKIQFDKKKQEMMPYCCGGEPPQKVKEEYEKLKATMQEQHLNAA